MRLGALEFRPGFWPTLITLVLLGVLISLGFWQLGRADQKRQLVTKYEADSISAPLRLDPARASYQGMSYRVVEASGYFDATRQLLLDNQVHSSHVGYQVLTPFVLENSRITVLVNRGWVPLGNSRDLLPDPLAPAGVQRITARIKLPVEEVFMLAGEESRSRWPWRIQSVQMDMIEKELGYSLMPLVLLLESDVGDGLLRDWKPLKFGPERNLGYAVQWFGLALTLLIIYLVVNTKKAYSTHE